MFPRRRQFVWYRALLVAIGFAMPVRAWAASDTSSLQATLQQAVVALRESTVAEPIDLARQTLLAENPAPAIVDAHLARLSTLSSQLDATDMVVGSNLDKTTAIHRFMHAQILGGYDAQSHTLGELLESGRYNCLSATLLLVALAERYELPLVAVESPGHITVGLLQSDEITIVETTQPLWQPEQAIRQPWSAAVDARPIYQRQLLAAVHFNRGWRLLCEGDYAAAAQANAAALRLDRQCLPAHKNLLASLNNWAVALCAAQQYTQALEVLRAGQAIDGTFAPFEANRQHVLNCTRQARGADANSAR